MSLLRFLLSSPPLHSSALLDPDTSKHMVKVMRLRPGDAVTLFDGKGTEWPGTIAAADRRGVRVEVGEPRPAAVATGPRVILGTAIPKGKRMSTLLSMATEAGVDLVVPLDCARSAVRGVRPAKVEHWGRTVLGAVRQSGRAFIPTVDAEVPLAEFLARPPAAGERRFLASTGPGALPLAAVLGSGPPPGTAVLLVGPEGGFTPAEEQQAIAAGFAPCSLGPHVLRVETAAVAATAVVKALFSHPGETSRGGRQVSDEEE